MYKNIRKTLRELVSFGNPDIPVVCSLDEGYTFLYISNIEEMDELCLLHVTHEPKEVEKTFTARILMRHLIESKNFDKRVKFLLRGNEIHVDIDLIARVNSSCVFIGFEEDQA